MEIGSGNPGRDAVVLSRQHAYQNNRKFRMSRPAAPPMSPPVVADRGARLPARVWLVVPACLFLPLLAAWIMGKIPPGLFQVPPPMAIPRAYPHFSWWAAGAILAAAGAFAIAWMVALIRKAGSRSHRATADLPRRRFPVWGRLALLWTVAWWVLAWTRFPWFAETQRYTFAPLWLGFVVFVNAVTWSRRGPCLMVRAPGQWLALFGASALFWWLFEWLNRFVQNWHYPIVARVGALEYVIHGSLCFSTVLPAVTAVREYLGSWPGLQARLAAGPCWSWLRPHRMTAAGLIAVGLAGLLFTGVRPRYFYPALWAAPLLLGVGLAMSRGARGWWSEIAAGDWRDAASWMLAGLICGGCWELWNDWSFAKWTYTVPFVDRWHVFEMPLPGYTGYLPFGLECGLAVAVVSGLIASRSSDA